MGAIFLPILNVGLLHRFRGGLSAYKSLMAFWSDTFDFDANTLLDKSGNGNDVPLINGNCVNFINDVTITLSVAQIGATVSEVNFSGTTTGVTVNGSGHIEIVQASLPVAKLYQIKLSTGDEFFLTGGTNQIVFCNSGLYGLMGTYGSKLNVSNCENGTAPNDFQNFANATPTGFDAISDGLGTYLAGTADEINFVSGETYEVAFDQVLNSGTAATVAISSGLIGSDLSVENRQDSITGANVLVFTCNLSATGVVQFRIQNLANDFEITNLSVRKKIEGGDYKWETQDDYFGNLQNGFSKEGLLFNYAPVSILDYPAHYFIGRFTRFDADTVKYIGEDAGSGTSSFRWEDVRITIGKTYQVKITVSNSTEDFALKDFQVIYLNNSQEWYADDDGVELWRNGEHIITIPCNYLSRTDFRINDSGKDYLGKNLDCYVNYIKEIDTDILIPAYSTTDAAGNTLTHPALSNKHNGCEVEIDFSGISGVTEAGGGAWSGPAAYTFSDTVTNPMFKRVAYNDNLQEIESDYIVFKSFINTNTLSSVLVLMKESNMLMKYFPNENSKPVLVIQKYDSTRDVVTVFCEVGYNGLYTYSQQFYVSNTKQLPVGIELSDLGSYNEYGDRIGPYNINGLGWVGGAHVAPSSAIYDSATWEEITAVDDVVETITLGGGVSKFPSQLPSPPPTRMLEVMVWDGSAYAIVTRNKYEVSGLILTLSQLGGASGVDLSGVVPGAADPPYASYQFQTGKQSSLVKSSSALAWAAIRSFEMNVINDLLDYTTIDKPTLVGDTIIQETVNYKIHQESPTVYIDYLAEFLSNKTVDVYYGMQGYMIAVAGGNARMYLAHSDDETLRAIASVTSGARATYPCEKVITVDDVTDNDASLNLSNFMDLSHGTPAAGESTNDFWNTNAKNYFQNIHSQAKVIGNEVTWRGGFNIFKNHASTQYVLAYFQWENGSLYFIVDFTDSLTFGSINEVFTVVAGRNCVVDYKDASITISGTPGSSFTIPDTGLDLTATAAGNIKIKLT